MNTSALHLNVVGTKDVSSAFKTEGVCDVIFEGGGCQINNNLMPSDGIIISCNNSTSGNGFSASILGVSLPNNTSGSSIVGSVVLLNDTEDTRFNSISRDDQVSVIAHEIGHALGLATPLSSTVLCIFQPLKKEKH